MTLRLLLSLSLLLAWQKVCAQLAPADDFFNGGAQLYISNNIPAALERVEGGLKIYPDDVKLKKLEQLLKQQQQQQQQNQQQQNQQQQQKQDQQKNQQNQQQQNQQPSKDSSKDQQKKDEQKHTDSHMIHRTEGSCRKNLPETSLLRHPPAYPDVYRLVEGLFPIIFPTG